MIIDFYNKNGGSGTVPIATRDTAGIVKVGTGLTIDSGGTLSVSGGTGGGLAIYDYDVISSDSTARGELIDLVSGGTQTAVVVKDGIMYYYRGYDEGEFKYVFVDYKNVILPEQPQHSNRFHFRAIKVDANQAYQDWFEQVIYFDIQQWMYTTSYYYKQGVSTNGFLYASDNTYDVIPGSAPKVGETYTNIYFTIPGMNWVSNGLTVTVNGVSHALAWWGGKAWLVDGEVYGEDHTTEAGMTVDFSHIDGNGYGYIGISAAAMTVTEVPENGEGGGTSIATPVLANYNLQMYRSGEWHSICGVPNLIFSGASQGILASAVSTVKAGLYNGAYAGNDTFYIIDGNVSQEAQSIVYTANTGVSETVTLKSTDYTAVIVRTISGDTYSLTLTKNPSLWIGTQAEYDAITAKSNTTLYVIVPAATGQPANEIWYTHTGETIITPSVSESGFNPTLGNSIVSNIYSNGMGKMVFANPITVIPDNAFDSAMSDGDSFPTISFPEGVTTLGSNILRYCHMAGVSIPSTVTTLSSETFNNMYVASEDSGATIVIPSGVTVIPQSCFSYTQASSITLPSTITEIGNWGFYEVWTADGSITFEGTSTQWNDNITFGENWMGGETNLCEIKCSDSTTLDYCS